MKGPMPPWHQFRDVLAPADRQALLDWTIANRDRFRAAGLRGAGVDPSRRIADKLKDLGPFHALVEARLRELLPEILARIGVQPFPIEHVELNIAAHGDGAFFSRHRDIPIGPGRAPIGGDRSGTQDRLVSAVFYFHREPKAFSGGALRLYRIGGDIDLAEDRVEVAPLSNSLLVFPSWAIHEVCRVDCPSGRFEDHRFAINAWFCRTLE
jgi:SM-20-related protein